MTTRRALVAAAAVLAACGPAGRGDPARQVPNKSHDENATVDPSISPGEPAELILRGGVIETMDEATPRAQALAVRAGRVVWVGTDEALAARAGLRTGLIGPETRIVELAGRMATPGLVDAHCHLYGLGVALESVSVRGATSANDVARIAAEAAKARPADAWGAWITGRGWDQNLWKPARFPHRKTLDAAVGDRPVALRRIDGHALWANTAALKAAGITRRTRAPAGGRIVRDPDGEPTGVFVDAAMDLVERHIPASTDAVRERRILAAAKVAVAAGLTGVHEMGLDDATVRVYRALAERGALPLRVNGYLSGDADVMADIARAASGTGERLAARTPDVDTGDSMFSARGIKLYADGALGSRGAALLAPYADDPGNRGLMITTPEQLAASARAAAAAGWQLATHAIGDAANRAVLDAYEQAYREHPGGPGSAPGQAGHALRFRVEHAQVLAPADIPRFGQLGVLASVQPTHATSDMPWAEARLGAERVRGSYAWRSVIEAGGRLVAGSDFPVEEVAPLLGLYAAVTRMDAGGQPAGGWRPAQVLTLAEALRAFTVAPAYAAFVEDHRGRLAPGMVADITVFDRVLVAGTELLATRVEVTVVGGRIVYERPCEARCPR